jgi:endonuclease/exonuclease/phosphatase family metal-dependent hydrolase
MTRSWRGSWRGLALGLLALGAGACSGGGDKPGLPFTVLTRNIYLGSDLMPLVSVPNPAAVPAAFATLWNNVLASDYPERAKVLAQEITTLAPDLVALQEVSLYRKQTPSDYHAGDLVPNATDVALDFLATLMAEIDARGGGYRVASEAPNADSEFPVSDGAGGLFDLRAADRDVILARTGVTTSNPVQLVFHAAFGLNVGGAGGVPIKFVRSASHVDADVGGARFTFATSHLEIEVLPTEQLAQADELLAAFAALPGPVVLAGDFNSAPGQSSYPRLTQAFHDAAADLGTPQALAVTCCQAGDLKNPTSQAGERIDLVLTRGAVRARSLQVIGADPATDRTPGGLWPSDHFGVLAKLELVP